MRTSRLATVLAWIVLALLPAAAAAQGAGNGSPPSIPVPPLTTSDSGIIRPSDTLVGRAPFETVVPLTAADSLVSSEARVAARADTGFHLLISLEQRRLWALHGSDTLRTAPVAVGMDARLDYRGRTWIFKTPRGARIVLAKRRSPVWIPPEWHYVEVAREHHFRLARLSADSAISLRDGTILEIRHGEAGLVFPDSVFAPLPADEEIIFDSTLYVPPLGTRNREIEGELGAYQLDLGGGYLIHGTPHDETIGHAATHGCIRLHDDDIAWLYAHAPIGTPVYIY